LLRQRESGCDTRLVQFLLEDPAPLLYHDEPIWRDDQMVGRTTSGAYGHYLGGAVALGYVRHGSEPAAAFVAQGRFEIEVANTRFKARASLTPFYDPKNERIRS
jgi:glycine cleavage system aminomethyltransferase T